MDHRRKFRDWNGICPYLCLKRISPDLTARRKDRLDALSKKLAVPCLIVTGDLSKEEECYRIFDLLKEERIDVFINNAGFGTCGKFSDTDLEKEINMLHVNVAAMHILFKLVLRKMQSEGRGTILNVASSAGLLPAGPLWLPTMPANPMLSA